MDRNRDRVPAAKAADEGRPRLSRTSHCAWAARGKAAKRSGLHRSGQWSAAMGLAREDGRGNWEQVTSRDIQRW